MSYCYVVMFSFKVALVNMIVNARTIGFASPIIKFAINKVKQYIKNKKIVNHPLQQNHQQNKTEIVTNLSQMCSTPFFRNLPPRFLRDI
jgi:uncharacterized protein (UPF0333 family)